MKRIEAANDVQSDVIKGALQSEEEQRAFIAHLDNLTDAFEELFDAEEDIFDDYLAMLDYIALIRDTAEQRTGNETLEEKAQILDRVRDMLDMPEMSE